MNKGWIQLHRQMQDDALWFSEPFTKAQAWVDLILGANHSVGYINIRGNLVKIERGQLGWSELTMSKRWKWSRGKVRRYLELLENLERISIQQGRRITTIITICNYSKFQNSDTADDTTDDTADGQQTDNRRYINNNDKKNNNIIKKNKIKKFIPPKVDEVAIYCKERGNSIDPQSFVDHYEANGWMRGKNKIKSWKACVRTWERNQKNNNGKQRGLNLSGNIA